MRHISDETTLTNAMSSLPCHLGMGSRCEKGKSLEFAGAILVIFALPTALIATWLALRFAPKRRVPRSFFYISASLSGLCLAIAILLLVLPRFEQSEGGLQGIGQGMAAVVLVANGLVGLIVLPVLAVLPQDLIPTQAFANGSADTEQSGDIRQCKGY